jgi:hypothetical protein
MRKQAESRCRELAILMEPQHLFCDTKQRKLAIWKFGEVRASYGDVASI